MGCLKTKNSPYHRYADGNMRVYLYREFLWQHWVNEELKRVKAINYDSHTQRSDNVIVLKSREKLPRDEICAKTSVERKATIPGNSIYTSLTTFPVLVHLLSYYDWVPATCNIHTRHPGGTPYYNSTPHTGRLRPKGVPYSSLRYMKG